MYYLYTYSVEVATTETDNINNYSGVTCAQNYRDAFSNISNIYEDFTTHISHIELDQLDESLAPCIEFPEWIIENLKEHDGTFQEEEDNA